jgi:hypothetical protein
MSGTGPLGMARRCIGLWRSDSSAETVAAVALAAAAVVLYLREGDESGQGRVGPGSG